MYEYCNTCGHGVTNDRTKHLISTVFYDENGNMVDEYCNDSNYCGEACTCFDSAINRDRKRSEKDEK